MTPEQHFAEVARLEAEIEAIITAETAEEVQRRPAHDPLPPGWRVRRSPATKPLQAQLEALKRQAKFPPSLAVPLAADRAEPTAGPISSPARRLDTRTREEKIRAIAAGMPIPLPAEMVAAAVGSQKRVDEFALEAADYVIAAQAAAAHEAELSAAVARITASDQPVSKPHPDAAVEAMAQSIIQSAAMAEGKDLDSVARRIAGA